jgi:hypothetical protein
MTLALWAAGLVLAVAAAVIAHARLRARHGSAYQHFRCPACRQRLRFQARKAGRTALCPNCLAVALLPRPGRRRPVAELCK